MRRIFIFCALLLSIVSVQAQATATCPNLLPSRLTIGEQARVIILGGSNLRATPGTTSFLLNIVPTDAVVQIVDGPFCGLSFAWWQIEYANQRGWVAEGADGQYWLEPFDPPTGQIGRVFIQATPDIATGFEMDRLLDLTELTPVDYPLRGTIAPVLRVYDVLPPDNIRATIQAILAANDPTLIESPAAANQAILRYADGVGVRYTTLDFDPENPEPTTITYEFRGISDNGRYVSATFPLDVTDLPFAYVPSTSADEATLQAYNVQYLQQTTSTLNRINITQFTPLLSQLDAMLQTLQTNAIPPQTGDWLTYRDETLRVAYPQNLIESLSVEAVAPDVLPIHTRYDFGLVGTDVTIETVVRIFRTSDLDSNWLARLQMVFARRLANPPNLTTYETREEALGEVALVRYLPFENGQGMRFVRHGAGTPIYYFQGITANNAYYITLTWTVQAREPIAVTNLAAEAFSPDLDVLDTLAESFEVLRP